MLFVVSVLVGLVVTSVVPALATPSLTLYVPGASYVDSTWVTSSPEFDLQVIGTLAPSDPGIADVNLFGALEPLTDYSKAIPPSGGSIVMTYLGQTNSSFEWGTPKFTDGTSIPSQGLFDTWFTTLPVGNFPSTSTHYVHVKITGFSDVVFTAADHYITVGGSSKKPKDIVHYVKVPGSENAGYNVPEPGSIALLACGAFGLLPFLRRRRTA